MGFDVGEKCWLVVNGDPAEGANCHEVTITATDEKTGTVSCQRDKHTDEHSIGSKEYNGGVPISFPAMKIDGLIPGEMMEDFIKDEGKGKGFSGTCKLVEWDNEFAQSSGSEIKGTYDDMVDMRKLNDAELMRNLRARFSENGSFCRCGVTLVAMNTYRMPKNSPECFYKDGSWKWIKNPAGAGKIVVPTDESKKKMSGSDFDPTKMLNRVFDKETLHAYAACKDRSLPPHAWGLASACFHELQENYGQTTGADQSIVITGESGAGKTYITKKMLDFLAEAGGGKPGEDGMTVTDKMLATTPILEGWGNANMPRNPDSSRFGKLYQIFFSRPEAGFPSEIQGCNIDPYMLEKSRVASQQMLERNFHIYYRIMRGPHVGAEVPLPKDQKFVFDPADYGVKAMNTIPKQGDYLFLDGGDSIKDKVFTRVYTDIPDNFQPMPTAVGIPARGFEDDENMTDTIKALKIFFDDDAVVKMILQVTFGTLILGNVNFKETSETTCEVDMAGKSGEAIELVNKLWQLQPAGDWSPSGRDTKPPADGSWVPKLATAISHAHMGKTVGVVPRSASVSKKLRDALAKTVYDKLFLWLVAECSSKLQENPQLNTERDNWIGVLDIFGFEFYEMNKLDAPGGTTLNSLDQYNINYCNEKLQKQFVKVIFELEQAEYLDQIGDPIITNETLGKIDNQDTLDLLSGKKSVVGCLNNASKKPGDSKKFPNGEDQDANFLKELITMSGGNKKTLQAENEKVYGKGKLPKDFKDWNKPVRIWMADDVMQKKKRWQGTLGDSADCKKNKWNDIGCAFFVQHYASEVLYDIRGWTAKDQDALGILAEQTMASSTCPGGFIDYAFGPKDPDAKKGASSVCKDFAAKLQRLTDTLESTNCNFVRCIKASNPLKVAQFTPGLVLNQLRYTGMLDTLNIRRLGFPSRPTHLEFWQTYHVLNTESTIADFDDDAAIQAGATSLAESVSAMAPQVAKQVMDLTGVQVPQEQIDVCIHVGQSRSGKKNRVLVRDWLARELDSMKNKILGEKAVAIQSAYRGCQYANEYKRESAAWSLQSCLRSCALRKPYAEMRKDTLKLLPELHAFTGRCIAAASQDNVEIEAAKKEMVGFLEDNKRMEQVEADERKMAAAEDEYAFRLSDATFGERVEADKKQHLDIAEKCHTAAYEHYQSVKAMLESTEKKGAEADARWQKMIHEGEVKTVPLVRQYKAESAPFQVPNKDAFRFKYSFSYKGAKAMNKAAAPAPVEAPAAEAPAEAPAAEAPAEAPAAEAPAAEAPADSTVPAATEETATTENVNATDDANAAVDNE
jgi:myosin heavy subunit